jgi:hypothetical protein
MNFFNSIGTEITYPSIRRITPLTMENEIVHEVPVLKGSPDIQEGWPHEALPWENPLI